MSFIESIKAIIKDCVSKLNNENNKIYCKEKVVDIKENTNKH